MRAALHGVEELGILRRFHGDLRVEHHVARQLGQLRHQLEALGAHRLELVQPRRIGAARGHREILLRHRVEVVVGKRDEAEALAPQLDDLAHHRVDAAHARRLAVGAPHRAERTVLRAAAHRLHRRPHVLARRQQAPSRRLERAAIDAAALVARAHAPRLAVAQHLTPDVIAIAPRHRVRAAELDRLVRIERRVNAAVDDVRAALARRAPDFVAAQRVAGMDADADDVAGCTLAGSNRSSVSSTMTGSPKRSGVAAASTKSQRGVMTAIPNDTSLGFTR